MRFARYRTAIPDAPGNRSGFATSSPGTAAVEGEARCSPAEGASMEDSELYAVLIQSASELRLQHGPMAACARASDSPDCERLLEETRKSPGCFGAICPLKSMLVGESQSRPVAKTVAFSARTRSSGAHQWLGPASADWYYKPGTRRSGVTVPWP